MRAGRSAGAFASALLVLTACTGAPPTRAGARVEAFTLRTVWGNGKGGIGSDVLAALASGTAASPVLVETPPEPGVDTEDNEGAALKALRENRADLTVVRSDSLESTHARAIAALTAPFVVTNEDQALRVARDPAALAFLADLAGDGLVGLGIAPGGLRHPVGYRGVPLLLPEDLVGGVINTRVGPGVERIVRALGGTVDHSVDIERSRRVADKRLRGIEVSFLQSRAADKPAVATSNVTLYTKFDVVVVRKQAFDAMSAAQQAALRRSVADAIAAALASRGTEATALDAWCAETDASSIVVSDDAVRRWRAALAGLTAELRRDGPTARAIDRFLALHEGTLDPLGRTCAGPTTQDTAPGFEMTPVGDQRVLDGTWRTGATMEQLLAAGISYEKAAANAGVWTIVVKNGKADLSQPSTAPCVGVFSFDGDRVRLDLNIGVDNGCGGLAIGTWQRSGDTVLLHWVADLNEEVVLDNVLLGRLVRVR